MNLRDLAEQYNVYVEKDSDFQRKARILQSIWRAERKYPMGDHRGQPLGSRLAMPWAERELGNYLTDTIKKVVQGEVSSKNRVQEKLYAYPRIYNDLLSSQSLTFNLFGELQQDLPLATTIFKSLLPNCVEQVTGIEFEFAPGRGDVRYIGDRIAFDVLVNYQNTQGQRGLVAIEVKYHEDLREIPTEHRPRYDEIAQQMGCFREVETLKTAPLQHFWRNHLLAGAMQEIDGYTDVLLAVLYPQGNLTCAKAVEDYRSCLVNEQTFTAWTLEAWCAAVKADWMVLFTERYLNFARLNKFLE